MINGAEVPAAQGPPRGSRGMANTAPVSNAYDGIQYSRDFKGLPGDWTTLGSVSASGGQMHLIGNGVDGNTYAYRPAALSDGQAARFTFRLSSAAAQAQMFVDSGTWNTSDYRAWAIKADGTNLIAYW